MSETAGNVPLAELCCPVCRGDLVETGVTERALQCQDCKRVFPVILGIPDLRTFPDPYIGLEADRAKGQRLADRAAETDFAGLVDSYYKMPDTEDTPDQARRFAAGLRMAAARSEATLAAWRRLDGPAPAGARLLEVGCGTGPLLLHARKLFADVIGVDIAFRWLVVARKRLQEAGADAPLVCACAEALPLRDATRDVVAAESTFEVTRDPRAALNEVRRVLRPGGRIWITTPNRWSLGPDAHLGVMAGGWLPRGLIERLARRQGALVPQRDLLSAHTLGELLTEAGFEEVRMGLPDLPPRVREALSPAMHAAGGVYQTLKELPMMRELLLAIGPVLLATARRGPDAA